MPVVRSFGAFEINAHLGLAFEGGFVHDAKALACRDMLINGAIFPWQVFSPPLWHAPARHSR